jgi:hypothetical protein
MKVLFFSSVLRLGLQIAERGGTRQIEKYARGVLAPEHEEKASFRGGEGHLGRLNHFGIN